MKGALLSTFSATNLDTGAIIDLSGTRPQHSSTTGGFIAYFSISPPGPYRIDLAYTDGLVTAAYSTQLEITGTYNAILHSKDLAWPEALEATIHASRHNHVDLDTIRARFTLIDIAGQGNLVCDQVQLSPIPPRESRTASCASENTGEYRVLEVDLGDWTDDNNHNNIATRAFEPPPAVTLDLAMTPIPSPLTAHHKVTRTVTATYSAPDHPVKGAEAIIKLFTPDGALLSTSTTAYTAPDGSVQLAFRVPRAAGLYGWQIEVTDSTLTGILSGDFNVHVRDAYIEHDHITLPVAPQLGEPVELRAEIHATTNSELLTNIPFGFAVTWYERNVDPPALQSEYLTPYLTVDALAPGAASESLTAMWTPPAGGPSTYVVIGAIGGHEDDPNAPGWRDDNPGNDQATQALLYGDHLRVTFADPQVAVFPPGITSLIPIEVAAVDGSPLVPDDLASFELIFSGAHEATYDLLPHYDPGLQQYVFAFQPPLDSYGELSIYAAALAHNGIDGLAARGGVIADSDVVYVDHSAPGPHNGSSWTSAWLTIEDALADPRSAIAPIHVADGDYTPPNSLRPTTGVTIRGGFGGETRLLANGPVAILELEGLPGVTLEQLTFTGVNGAYSALSVYDPTAADTLIDRCRFVDNDAEYGAITIRNGHLTIRDSYFENNNSNFGSGGAVNAQFRANSTMELTGCEFRNNTATNSGGAIYAEGGTLLVDCTFTGNSSDDGGAIHFDAGSNTIRNCQFVANSATSHGSALFLGGQSGNLLLEGSLFDANSGNQAIANFGFGATVRSCEFRNHADVLWFNESGRLDMANSIVHHNSGPVLDNQGDVEIVNCTIANNGDVLVNLAALKLYNSILWGNTGTPILGEYSGSHNIIEDADPRFRDPANGDYHLEPGLFDGNPAFDAGNNDEVPPDVSEDFEGNPRIRNVYVDIGAYEADPLAHGLVISGLITFDENGDATPNPNEVGMPDISLELRRARLVDGVVVADELDARYNTLTDDDGNYAIIVPPGIYTLRVVIPRGFTTQYSPYSVFDELTAEDSIFAEAPGTYIGNGSLAALGDIVYVTQRIVPLGFFTGTSWRNAFPNLEVALQRVPIGGSIWISEATYSNPPAENDPRTSHYYTDSVSIYGGFRGDETSLDQRPADAETILSGDDGGHRVLFIRQGDPVLLDRLTIRDGGGSDGGAIHTRSDLELRDCRIVDNQAGIGGGVYVTEIANLLATGCVFEGNTVSTDTGAAIYARGDRTTIVNSLFHGHQGSSVIHIAAGVADFANNTLAVNEGDALVLGATATGAIANSIFSDSAGTAVTGPVAPAFSCFFGNSGDYQPGLPASNLSADPRLSPDFMLFADSPCIDAGDNAALDPVWTTDLVGEPRIVNGTIDIGATEHNPRSIYVDDTATGNNDGSSWTDAFTDLQDGLGVADPGDSIHIAAGSYVSTAVSYQLESGVTVLGGYPDGGGARDPATYLTQLGPDGTNPIIHHSGRDIDNSAILDGVTLSGALNGAVRNGDASPTFRNCTFSNNRISGDGGAFHNGGGSPTFVDCRFANNVADGAFGRGGAIFNDGNMTITRCQFQGNEATDSAGAIYVLGVLTITDGDFQTNRATHGGGALSLELLEGENVSVIGCTFDGNTVSGSGQLRGGGAIESWPGSPTITNCIFANNSVVEGGGAIFNADFGPTFDANPAITNCLFYGNSAGSGAAFYNRGPGVSPTLTNCTFTRNSATISGGALHNDGGTPLLTNAIIWANSAPADPQIAGDTVSVAHSIVEGGYPGTGNLDLDPLFGDGYRPRPGSPAIDSGESVALPATDLDGNPRVVGAGVDRGAYELQVDIPPELFVDSGERIGSAASFAVALGRLDGDDNLDAFIATRRSHLDSGANLVWLGNGDASFTDSGQRLGFQNSGSVALGYINDDPYLDAAIANDHESARGAANRVWWGNADGSFTDSGARFGSAETSEVALADLDGDGDLDLLFANGIQQGVDSGANEIWLYEDGGFISGGSFGPAESTGIAAAGNIVFVTNANQTDTIWEIVGDGTLRLAGQTSAANNSQDVALADLNGDGHLDAFVTNGSNQPDYVYFNQGGFDFQDSGQRLGNTYSRAVALGDLNGDGFLDAFVASIDNKPDTIWYNDGSGHFYDSGQRLNPGWSWDVALGDLDGDGDLDAYLAKGNTGGGADEVWINTWPRAVHVDREAPGPIHDGLSWATAYRSIPEGVNDSRAVATPIHVADGSYTDHVIVADDRHIVGGFGGDTVITVVDDLGAILVQAGRLTVRDLIFDRCRAELGSGGALNSLIHGSLDVANCEFRNGFATNDGGAIHTEGGENSVRHSIFVGNESVAGSAIGVYGGQLNLRHCELRNHVGHNVIDVPSGGANIVNCLFVDNQGNPVHAGVQTEIVNSTFSGNQLGLFGQLTLRNSILWGNGGLPLDGNVTVSHSIVEDIDPLFENGYHPATDSPAIDAGGDFLPADLRVDLDGLPRRIGPVDLGVYEASSDCDGAYTLFRKTGAAGSHFGHAIAPDGQGNFIVGARGTSGAGEVVVYSGYDGHILHHLVGNTDGARFGCAVAGNAELIVVGEPQASKVYLYAADTGEPIRELSEAVTQFGLSLALVDDSIVVSGDGVVFRYDLDGSPIDSISRGGDFGYAVVSLGDGRYGVSAMQADRVSIYADGDLLFELRGQAGEWFGRSLAAAGDADNDGVGDVLVGSSIGDTAYLYSGATGELLHSAPGGIAVASAGDANHDGYADFAATTGIYSGFDGSLLHGFDAPVTTLANLGFGLAIGDYQAGTCEVRKLAACAPPPVIAQGFAISASTDEDVETEIALDISGQNPVAEISHGPSHGRVELATFDYGPLRDYNGEDRFYVRVTDDGGEVAVTEVIVTVNPINDPPELVTPPSFDTPIFAGDLVQPVAGIWTDARDLAPGQITLSFQWLSADSASGDNPTPIPGATSLDYQTSQDDGNRWLALEVTAIDDGEGLPASASSVATTEFAYVVLPLDVGFVHPPTHLPVPVAEGGSKAFEAEVGGGVAPYVYTWTIDDVPVSSEVRNFSYEPDHVVVVHPNFSRDVTLVCRVTDSGGIASLEFVWTVRVGDVDRLPPAPEISILPVTPGTLDTLSLNIVADPVDPDGDVIVGYDISWRLIGASRDAFTGPTLDWRNTAKGQAWRAAALPLTQPYGGLEYSGHDSGEATTFIHNTAPTAVHIGPIAVADGTPVEIQLIGDDPDVRDGTDSLQYEIVTPPQGSLVALNPDGLVRYTPAGVADSFTYRVRDNESAESAAATVDLDVAGWSLSIDVTNGELDNLLLGVHPNPPPNIAIGPQLVQGALAAFEDSGELLRAQYRAEAPGAEWTLLVDAREAEAPVLLSWDGTNLPLEGLYLDEPGGNLVIDMAERNSVTVEAGELRSFRVRYARVAFTMTFARGWNLISLPIVPVENQLDILFPAPLDTGLVFGGNELTTTKLAEVGRVYWVHNDGPPLDVTFEGSKAPPEFWQTELLLIDAWNPFHVVGSPPWAPRRRADVIYAEGRIISVLGWHPSIERWRPGPLLPGRGYLGYVRAP
jgi:predicted outer membrane repeat protein